MKLGEQNDDVAVVFILGVASEHCVPRGGVWLGHFIEQLSGVEHFTEARACCDETWRDEIVVLESMGYYLGLNLVEVFVGFT